MPAASEDQSNRTSVGPRRKRFGGTAALLTGAVALCLLWVVYWYGARQIGAAALDRVAAAAAARGYAAECDDISGGGFPLSVNLSCSRASLSETDGGLQATVNGFVTKTLLYRPWSIQSTAAGPLELSLTPNDTQLTARWKMAATQIDASIGGLSSLKVRLDGLQLSVVSNAEVAPFADLAVAHAEITVSPGSGNHYSLSGVARELAAEAEDGSALPVIDLTANLTALDFGNSLGLDPRQAFAEWIDRGGAIRIDNLTLTADSVSGTATGELALSDDGTISGDLNLTIAGVDELPDLVESFYPEAGEKAGQIVAAVVAFTRPTETPSGPARQMTVLIRNSVVSIGILPIGVIPPLAF
jgi:hypothetical protein